MNDKVTSCNGCINYLGGGCCRINVEDECEAGGGFELYEPIEGSVTDGRKANVHTEDH